MFTEEWREAADDPTAREVAARRRRPKPKKPETDDPPGPVTPDLF